jgi:hypothetical protein
MQPVGVPTPQAHRLHVLQAGLQPTCFTLSPLQPPKPAHAQGCDIGLFVLHIMHVAGEVADTLLSHWHVPPSLLITFLSIKLHL